MSSSTFDSSTTHGNIGTIFVDSLHKFTPDGVARPFVGITVLSHLKNESQQALRRAMNHYLPDVDSDRSKPSYVKLPEASLHVTIFDTKVYYPETLDGLQPLEARAREIKRFRQAFETAKSELQKHIPIKMKIDLDSTRCPVQGDTLKVPLAPYDEDGTNKLRSVRHILGAAFDKQPVDDAYKFHITMYYPLYPLSGNEFTIVERLWLEATTQISNSAESFIVDDLELCQFDDMCKFEIIDSATGWRIRDRDASSDLNVF